MARLRLSASYVQPSGVAETSNILRNNQQYRAIVRINGIFSSENHELQTRHISDFGRTKLTQRISMIIVTNSRDISEIRRPATMAYQNMSIFILRKQHKSIYHSCLFDKILLQTCRAQL